MAEGKRPYRMIQRHPPPMIDCAVCSTPFRARGHWRTRPNLYCSNECRLSALNALPKWNKGRKSPTPNSRDYVRVWDGTRQVMEHRLVMEKVIGRKLRRAERVHHRNGNRADNRPENLVLYASHREHLIAEHPELVHNLPNR